MSIKVTLSSRAEMMVIPRRLFRIGGCKLFLADSTESAHKNHHRLSIEAAAAHVQPLYVVAPRAVRPICLNRQQWHQKQQGSMKDR